MLVFFSISCSKKVFIKKTKQLNEYQRLKQQIIEKFSHIKPVQWGEFLNGITTRFNTSDSYIALTFDACGGNKKSNGYDKKLISYLIQHNISATLFITTLWAKVNPDTFQYLNSIDLFEIENHGLNHKPCSVNGKSVYGVKGTKNITEAFEEVELSSRYLEKLTGTKPLFYRSGTAYYDDVAIQMIKFLGYQIAGYSVLGDAGATFKKSQVKTALLNSRPGDIVLLHMNHPESDTAEGVIESIPIFISRGYKFVKLNEISI